MKGLKEPQEKAHTSAAQTKADRSFWSLHEDASSMLLPNYILIICMSFDAPGSSFKFFMTLGLIMHSAQCDARHSASFFLVVSVPCCLNNSKCTCAHLFAHGRAGLKTRCVQVHCWCMVILRQLKTIAQLTRWSLGRWMVSEVCCKLLRQALAKYLNVEQRAHMLPIQARTSCDWHVMMMSLCHTELDLSDCAIFSFFTSFLPELCMYLNWLLRLRVSINNQQARQFSLWRSVQSLLLQILPCK